MWRRQGSVLVVNKLAVNKLVVKKLMVGCVFATLLSATAAVPAGAAVPGVAFTETSCQDQSDSVARLYTAAFDRTPDQGGFEFWLGEYAAGNWTLPTMAAFFESSDEFTQTYGALNDQAFVEQLYRNVLGRDGDAGGIAFWNDLLATGTTRATILLRFSESPENVQNTGTTEPSLGFYNQGVTEPFACALAELPQDDAQDPNDGNDPNDGDDPQDPPGSSGGDLVDGGEPPPREGMVEITECLAVDEIVVIANNGDIEITLTGLVLSDEGGENTFALDDITLSPGQRLGILSGDRPDAGRSQIVGWTFDVWDDDGDTASITDADDNVIAQLACT